MAATFHLDGTLKRFSVATTRTGYECKYEVEADGKVFVVVSETPDRPDFSDLEVGVTVDAQGTLGEAQLSGDLKATSVKKARA